MSAPALPPKPSVWRVPIMVWVALLALLTLTVIAAYLPLGPVKLAVSLAIAGAKALLIAIFFMRLNKSSSLVRLTACAGFLWLIFMFMLAGTDYFTRP